MANIRNKSKRNLGRTLLVGGLLALAGCNGEEPVQERNPTKTIKISEYKEFDKRGTWRKRVAYCGMPNKETFSIAGQNNEKINLFYPIDSKEINFKGNTYEVVSVTSRALQLRILE